MYLTDEVKPVSSAVREMLYPCLTDEQAETQRRLNNLAKVVTKSYN